MAEMSRRIRQPVRALGRGTSLIEVLISMLVVAFGLLGLAGLQTRLHAAEMEAYQRSQALVLLDDMASRITTNRKLAASYVTTAANPLGAGITCPVLGATPTRQQIDTAAWCVALQGAAETVGGANAGAMIGGRGCVESLPNNEYFVTVAWQGLTPVSAPPEGVACGKELYDDAVDAQCAQDRCRRVVTTIVRIGTLN
jgi:type IV pilus assembly protein PilV